MRGGAFLKGKEGRVGFRKSPSLMVKKDGMILEISRYLIKKHYTSSPANFTFLPSTVANIISISFQKE